MKEVWGKPWQGGLGLISQGRLPPGPGRPPCRSYRLGSSCHRPEKMLQESQAGKMCVTAESTRHCKQPCKYKQRCRSHELLGPVYTKGKRRYFHTVWPLIYTKTQFLSQKTIISKNSGQSGDFWKRRLCVVVSTGRNRVLGSETSHYAPGNA